MPRLRIRMRTSRRTFPAVQLAGGSRVTEKPQGDRAETAPATEARLVSHTLSAIKWVRWQALAGSGLQTFKTKAFARFANREGLEDGALCDAVRRARKGLIDADLGGGVIKQCIARKGGGRSGGLRTIMLFRRGELAFFVYGFAKSDRDNVRRDELATFRLLADEYLSLDQAGLAAAQRVGAIIEVKCDDQAVQE